MTSDTDILTRFRSIDGKSSVKIRSSKYLETIDFSSYILDKFTIKEYKG